jgi:undecaprenyl-diphosphatase
VTAVLSGWVAGAATLVVAGGPNRRPTAHSIAAGLGDVGVHLAELKPASVDARGSTPYLGATTDGLRVFVKALGDDQRSADLLFRLYRKATRRELGDERPFSSLRRAVEHEGLVSLAAAGQGIRTPAYLAMGRAEPNGFSLAFEAIDGRSLDSVPDEQMTDDLLVSCWEQVLLLRRHRTAHRDLRLANLFRRADGTVLLIDFGFGELAASDLLLNTDVAELLASTATAVGPERAVEAARRVLGEEAVRAAVPRLETTYLSGATKTALGEAPEVLEQVRRLASGR